MSNEYAIQVMIAAPIEEMHAACSVCHWRRLEESNAGYQHFLNEAKSHCHISGHIVHITRASATTTTVRRRELTDKEEFRDTQGPTDAL